ncbi:MAG: uracil-DNA glycosylase, partial [Fimbriimonadaceae bacterium]|nr:uracil-DNA glycosylase [Fimbriimonadaceae bacterium]
MTLDELRGQALQCRDCALSERRRNVVFGEGNAAAPLVLVGEGPGEQEDQTGRPFVGRAGQLLDR